MPRRQLPESTDNHERWLISYADFITLLFATFVVLYSTAAVNKGSFRVLSDSIVAAFVKTGVELEPLLNPDAKATSAAPPEADIEESLIVPLRPPEAMEEQSKPAEEPPDRSELEQAELKAIAAALRQGTAELLERGLAELQLKRHQVELELRTQVLFPSGSRVLLAGAVPILGRISAVLDALPNEIRTEGYTDNQPIRSGLFDSNWELSSARATALVQEFEANGIEPARMSATGFGEHRPVADNATEQGQAANRRVVLVIKSTEQARREARARMALSDGAGDG